jgi:outer membrane protein OmpA-like peptidoglycan-associated protein
MALLYLNSLRNIIGTNHPFMKLILLSLFMMLQTGSVFAQSLVPTDKLALLRGTVTNFKGKLLPNETIIFSNDKTKAEVKVHTDAKGKFEALIPVNGVYSLKYKNFTTDVDYTKMTVPADAQATYEIQVKIEPPVNVVLDNVYFDTGKSTLKASSSKALNDLAEGLKLKSTMVVEIQGHTDNVGKEEENIRLSQQRADEVKKYLVAKGIDEKRISTKGYGPAMPIADNASEEGKAKNRRTSLRVIKE